MKKVSLVLDLDNTLYCWMDAFAPGLDAQITYIAKRTGLTKKIVKDSFKSVFQKHCSVEVVGAAEELDIWQNINISKQEANEIIDESSKIFKDVFADNLKMFPKVKETLEWAKANDIIIIAFSDGRAFWINFRLSCLGISDYFDRIYVEEDEISDKDNYPLLEQMILLPEDYLKPNTYVLDEIIRDYDLEKKNIYLVGDSKDKDIRTANRAGVVSVWAKYGKCYSQKSRRLLSSVTHWTRSQVFRGRNITPRFTISDFSEIKTIINFEVGI